MGDGGLTNLSKCLLHYAGTLLATLLLVGMLVLGWVCYGAPDFWNLSEHSRRLEEGKELEYDLDVRQKALYECVLGKDRVAREVIAGRLSLQEAAEQFRYLSLSRPDFNLERFRKTYAGATDTERHCRSVLYWVQALLKDQPEKEQQIVVRLERELTSLVSGGRLHLDT
jgi:hypothetical protein